MAKKVTIAFLLRDDEICLGMKKRGFGVGLWNGTGGKVVDGETPEDAAKREAKEEFGVDLIDLEYRGRIFFIYKDGMEFESSIYVSRKWSGEPTEGEEMSPKWFKTNRLPYESMWSDDKLWLPLILDGKRIESTFYFNDDAKTIEKFDVKEIN
ncbi:MAG: 8-oxo-dGTP diphosphatase [Candidatus Shapirobacteria bacterium]